MATKKRKEKKGNETNQPITLNYDAEGRRVARRRFVDVRLFYEIMALGYMNPALGRNCYRGESDKIFFFFSG